MDQDAVFAFLADPATHGLEAPVTRIETHGACVFLAGPDVYKVKRAVRFDFMDFSTLEKRRGACEAEVAINRPNAPGLYLGTVPITHDGQRFRLGGTGEAVEWAVHLRRFDETATLDRLALRGPFAADLVLRLARKVRAAHGLAPVRDGDAGVDGFKGMVCALLAALRDDAATLRGVSEFAAAVEARLEALEPLLRQRGADGQVRRCHGDLHLRNIVLIDGDPVLFDAIEFDEAIATGDVLYDLAFLLMDMVDAGQGPAANLLLNRYLWEVVDIERQLAGLAALPLFLAVRAGIRARVSLALARLSPERRSAATSAARRYFAAAALYLAPAAPRLVGIGGLSGTGKSTLAARVAPTIGPMPGAVHLRSDIERKRVFGLGELDPLPPEAYSGAAGAEVYARLRSLCAIALRAGCSVVADAVHRSPAERDALAAVADAAGVPFTGLWLEAPVDLLRRRVAARTGDASDATPEVVTAQAAQDVGPIGWHRLRSDRAVDELVSDVTILTSGD